LSKPATRAFFGSIVILLLLCGCNRKPAETDEASYGLHYGDMDTDNRVTCIKNLKQIYLGFKTWSLDHDNQFPFNLSSNAGGTLEYRSVDKEGFDTNAYLHIRAVSNELTTPLILLCPQDRKRTPAASFQTLQPTNLTYRLRSGTNIDDPDAHQVLMVCPLDGNILYCDGTVKPGK